jgi:preprotein translocase subunit SecF
LVTVLFTFLEGYNYIFAEIHGTSEGITGLCFLGIIIGLCSSLALVPLIYRWAKQEMAKAEEQGRNKIDPEFRLWVRLYAISDRLNNAKYRY